MGKHNHFRWYRMIGHPADGLSTDFIYYIESASPRNVIKYHGNQRRCYTDDGSIMVQFPSHEKHVEAMPQTWSPEQFTVPIEQDVRTVVKMFPATHYICECGREHMSDFPYRSMWCSCGKKAFPVKVTASSVTAHVQTDQRWNTPESRPDFYRG